MVLVLRMGRQPMTSAASNLHLCLGETSTRAVINCSADVIHCSSLNCKCYNIHCKYSKKIIIMRMCMENILIEIEFRIN